MRSEAVTTADTPSVPLARVPAPAVPRFPVSRRAPAEAQAGFTIAVHLLLLGLCTTHFLLPAERGFPLTRIGGFPFTITLLANCAAFAFLILIDGRGLLRTALERRFVHWQVALAGWMVFANVLAASPRGAYAIAASYFSVFVCNYLVFSRLFERGYRRLVTGYIFIFASLAACVGLAEGLTGTQLSIYAHWTDLFRAEMQFGDFIALQRVTGTLGNPIIFGALLCFAIPWILDLDRKWLRLAAAGIAMIAALFTLSRTVLVMIVPLALGELYITFRGRRRVKADQMIIVLVAGLLLSFYKTEEYSGTIADKVAGWALRMGDDRSSVNNIELRFEASKEALYRLFVSGGVRLFAGNGGKSSNEVGSELAESLTTLDNTYTTILYEYGIIGFLLFAAAWASVVKPGLQTARSGLHWASVVAFILAGLCFVTCYYATVNLPLIASAALLGAARKQNPAGIRGPADARLRARPGR